MTNRVDVYGADHSPWVQAVLLGLHDAAIPTTLTPLPPLSTFLQSGVMMPAARFDGGPWQMESAEILKSVGYDAVTEEHMQWVRSAWRGVLHRTDSAALFWGAFSLAGDRSTMPAQRTLKNYLRSFIPFYMFLLIRTTTLVARPRDPENYGDQFLRFEELLESSGTTFLSGESPNSLDFLLFGIIQCHCSVYVPPVGALQTDTRLNRLRSWIAAMHSRFHDYEHLYSGMYFAPHRMPPARASGAQRTAFWLGAATMIALFPVTVPLVAFLAIRLRKAGK